MDERDDLVWTDDMTIPLPPGRCPGCVVEFVLQAVIRDTPMDQIDQALAAEFALSEDDACLARDRTFGGVVRAGTQAPENRPDPKKDPIAATSYQRCGQDRTAFDQFNAWMEKQRPEQPPQPVESPSLAKTLWKWIRG